MYPEHFSTCLSNWPVRSLSSVYKSLLADCMQENVLKHVNLHRQKWFAQKGVGRCLNLLIRNSHHATSSVGPLISDDLGPSFEVPEDVEEVDFVGEVMRIKN